MTMYYSINIFLIACIVSSLSLETHQHHLCMGCAGHSDLVGILADAMFLMAMGDMDWAKHDQ